MTGFLLSVNFVQDPIKKVHFPCFCDAEVYYKLIYNQAAPDPPVIQRHHYSGAQALLLKNINYNGMIHVYQSVHQ